MMNRYLETNLTLQFIKKGGNKMKPSGNTRQLETWKQAYWVIDADRSVEGTRTSNSGYYGGVSRSNVLKFKRYSKRCWEYNLQQDRVIFLVSNFIASNTCKIQKYGVVNKICCLSQAHGLIL